MREEMGEWRFCLVFLLAIVTSTAASGCPQDSPDRNLLCYQTKFTEEELDPCLCTHWVLTRELLDEKDYLVERNEDLQIILSVETGETNLTQEIFHEGVQGIELSTLWTKTPKQLVKYVKLGIIIYTDSSFASLVGFFKMTRRRQDDKPTSVILKKPTSEAKLESV
ncbi:hypothetical protein M8J77_025214 [Diaphorina citri]|nr:hypothetical protein M8J77_025214 [Diaphorina citri]